MAFDGLLSQIANPQTADIAGALDFRQKRIQEEQQRQKDAKMKELFTQSVLPNLREGSVQYEMAKEDPERFIAYSKAMGVPIDNASMLEQQSKDVYALSNILDKNDPQGALDFAQTLIAEREAQGLNAEREKKWLTGALEEFKTSGTLGRSGNAIKMMNESLNGDLIAQAKAAQRKAELEERAMQLKEAELGLKAKELSMGGGENAGVQSSNILDDGTVIQVLKSGGTRVVDPSGNALSGQARADAIKAANEYGVNIQSARAGGRAGEAEKAKGNAGRYQEFINQGVTSAQALPTIKRSIDLLDSIETGGLDAARIKAKQMFGIESADEGELTYNLGKNVLSQLKDTFGSAFTAAEGERLAALEAGLGRNPESNKRILTNALQTMQKKAERGIQAARDNGDEFSASDIESYMKMNLGKQPEKSGKAKTNTPAQETAAQRLARLKANAN